MKRFLMIMMAAATMLFAGATKANAQDFNFDPAQMAQMRVDQMKESLNLDKDQCTKLLDLYKKQGEEMAKMFDGGMPDMSKFQEMQKKEDEAVKKILTDEQYKKHAEQQRKMREQFGGGF